MVLRNFISENFRLTNPYEDYFNGIRNQYCLCLPGERSPFWCKFDDDCDISALPKFCCNGAFLVGNVAGDLLLCCTPFCCITSQISNGIIAPIFSLPFLLTGAVIQSAIAAPFCFLTGLANAATFRRISPLDRLSNCCLKAATLSFVQLKERRRENNISREIIETNRLPSQLNMTQRFTIESDIVAGNEAARGSLNFLRQNHPSHYRLYEMLQSQAESVSVNNHSRDAVYHFLCSPSSFIDDPAAGTFYYESSPIRVTQSSQIGSPNKFNKIFLDFASANFFHNRSNGECSIFTREVLKFMKECIESYIVKNLNLQESSRTQTELILKNSPLFLAACENYGKKDPHDSDQEREYSTFEFYWNKQNSPQQDQSNDAIQIAQNYDNGENDQDEHLPIIISSDPNQYSLLAQNSYRYPLPRLIVPSLDRSPTPHRPQLLIVESIPTLPQNSLSASRARSLWADAELDRGYA